jgi:hypothetical protein
MYLASDSTQLSTHSGDVAAHAVYMTLANIDKATRASTSENAWILVAYIPKSKFKETMAKLEHRPKAVLPSSSASSTVGSSIAAWKSSFELFAANSHTR